MDHEGILQSFWALAPEPALLVDEAARVVASNPAFDAMYGAGLEVPSLAGRPLVSLLVAEDQARVRRELDPLAGVRQSTLGRVVPQRGDPITVELCGGLPQPGPAGGARRIVQLRAVRSDDPVAQLNRRIFDTLDNGVLWYDADMRIIDANQAARRMLALRADDLGNYRSDDLGWRQFDEEGHTLPIERRPVWQVLHGRQPIVASTIIVETPGGGRRWLRITAQSVASISPGRGAGAVASFVDVTEQRHAMRSLRDSEMLLRLFGDNASDVLWIVDPRTRKLLYVNSAFERLWGVSAAALYDDIDHWTDGIDPEDLPKVAAASTTPTAGGMYEMEYRLHPPGGPMRWIRGRGFPIQDAEGHVRYLAGFAEDITLAREAEAIREAHGRAQARLARIVATAPGAVVSFRPEPDGRATLLYASDAIQHLVGLAPEQLTGHDVDVMQLVHAEDRPRVRASLARADHERAAWRETFRVRRAAQGGAGPGAAAETLAWIEAHALPMDAEGGTVWQGFMLDVTERRQAEDEVRQLAADLERRVAERTAELEAKHREMESFTYSVSHDLKAPLRGIDGYSKLLETDHAGKLDDEGRFFVQMIRRAATQMGQLIDDLLAYSKVERGRPTLVALDPLPFVRSLVQERQPDVAAAGGALHVDLDGCGRVMGEREGLLLVLRNLLDNAIKFTAGVPARRIDIGARRHGDHVTLWVKDNGRGFDMRYHDRIFEIFQRLHRAEDYPGTGVGLAIVRKAAERMRGRAWAESVPGEGATFFLELPAA